MGNSIKDEFTFTSNNLKKSTEILSKYPPQYKKAALIPLLQLAQEQNSNWLPISAMNYVAKYLSIPPMRVYEVATFYTMFNREPVGKYFVQVCTTTPCQLCGASKILNSLIEEIGVKHVGETSKDGLFTLVEVECAGACVNAPLIAINDDYFEDLTEETAKGLIKKLRSGAALKDIPIGPQNGKRTGCEPAGGLTSLTEEPYGPGFKVRPDL